MNSQSKQLQDIFFQKPNEVHCIKDLARKMFSAAYKGNMDKIKKMMPNVKLQLEKKISQGAYRTGNGQLGILYAVKHGDVSDKPGRANVIVGYIFVTRECGECPQRTIKGNTFISEITLRLREELNKKKAKYDSSLRIAVDSGVLKTRSQNNRVHLKWDKSVNSLSDLKLLFTEADEHAA